MCGSATQIHTLDRSLILCTPHAPLFSSEALILLAVLAAFVEAVAAVLTSSATGAAAGGLWGAVTADAPLLALVAVAAALWEAGATASNPRPCHRRLVSHTVSSRSCHLELQPLATF